MFDGGGVPIDHYIIQVDNGTQLETPGPTHSFDIMYNTTLSVNISAHNCAGYSQSFTFEVKYNEGNITQQKRFFYSTEYITKKSSSSSTVLPVGTGIERVIGEF